MSGVISTEQDRLKFIISRVGRMTVDEALQIALEAEDILKQLQPGDIARPRFESDYKNFFEYAELLEKEEARNEQIAQAGQRLALSQC